MPVKITRYTVDELGNKTKDKEFTFKDGEVKTKDDQTNVNKVSVDFPSENDTEDSSFSINLGQEEITTFQFKIYYETDDRSNGTNTISIVNFEDIIPYLKRKIFKRAIGEVLYRVETTTKFETIDAYFTLQDFNINTNRGIYPEGSFKLKLRYYSSSPSV